MSNYDAEDVEWHIRKAIESGNYSKSWGIILIEELVEDKINEYKEKAWKYDELCK